MTGEKQMLEEKLRVQIATSSVMDNAIDLWKQMYKNRPPWIGGDDHVVPLNLPAAISEEMARLILTEFEFNVSGENERAEFIRSQMDVFLDNLSATMEIWAAMGGVAIKPYVASSVDGGPLDRIRLDIIQADRFFPTVFSSNGDVTGAVFVESKRVGEYLYTRLEHHNLEGTTYTVTNRAFRSEKIADVGSEDDQLTASNPFRDEVSLSSVDTWAGLEPETVINGVERPLFVYIRVPRGNNIDTESPLGTSVFSRAVDTIREADIQFSRILWEYRATEAAIDADASLFMSDRNGQPILPEGNDRL
ncbi:MAG: hypothetical protein LUD72_00755, partial [Bacteroidales bacterium]|nr:hypothetical protein [Bacteroidales bacterium]